MISNKELVSLVKEDVLETARKIKAAPDYPSTIIAYTIWLYNNKMIDDDAILDKNNIIGLYDEAGKLMSFNTIQQCLLTKTNEVQPEEFVAEQKTICKVNKLYSIDKAYVYSMNNAIDLTDEQKKPSIDQYSVKVEDGTVGKASTLVEAKEIAQNIDTKATIVNSMGDVVDTIGNSNKPIKTIEAVSISLEAGTKIELNDVNLYSSSRSTAPVRLISGTFYLYDGIDYLGKLAICLRPASSIDDIFGFINKNQL